MQIKIISVLRVSDSMLKYALSFAAILDDFGTCYVMDLLYLFRIVLSPS
jgi:hypothetical protein